LDHVYAIYEEIRGESFFIVDTLGREADIKGIKAARSIFGKARRGTHLTWHLYEASAMMEFHSNKDSAVAIKIFDLGTKKFPNEVDFVMKHLQFLLSINDDTSESPPLCFVLRKKRKLMIDARALFEKSALSIPSEKSRPLWDAWARYEYMYGDLAAVNKLEARFKEVFPNGMLHLVLHSS